MGGQVEQPPKTNPITRERFVSPFKPSISPHSVFCGIISLLRFRKHRHLFFWGVCFCSKSLFALFCTSCGSFSGGGGVTLFSSRMNYLKHNQLKPWAKKKKRKEEERCSSTSQSNFKLFLLVPPVRFFIVLSGMFTPINRNGLITLQLLFCYCSTLI